MNFDGLVDGQIYEVRLGRDGRKGGEDFTEWQEWKPRALYVRRRDKTLKRGREIYPAGEIVEITVKDGDWASYRQQDYDPAFDMWAAEDYYMQVRPYRG